MNKSYKQMPKSRYNSWHSIVVLSRHLSRVKVNTSSGCLIKELWIRSISWYFPFAGLCEANRYATIISNIQMALIFIVIHGSTHVNSDMWIRANESKPSARACACCPVIDRSVYFYLVSPLDLSPIIPIKPYDEHWHTTQYLKQVKQS